VAETQTLLNEANQASAVIQPKVASLQKSQQQLAARLQGDMTKIQSRLATIESRLPARTSTNP
jgi:hypothetical protein